jgi:hypothetical protein
MAKFAQPLNTILLIGAKPVAHRIVIQQQRSRYLAATQAFIEQDNRIRSPRHPLLRKPVSRQRNQLQTLLCR